MKTYQILILLLILMVGCRQVEEEEPILLIPTSPVESTMQPPVIVEGTTVVLTQIVPTIESQLTLVPTSTPFVVTPVMSPIPSPTLIQPVATEVVAQIEYQVAFVAEGDQLNVRSGPSFTFPIAGTLLPNSRGIRIIGASKLVLNSEWVEIETDTVSGWVNSRYLTAVPEFAQLCEKQVGNQIVNQLQEAIRLRDGKKLAELVHPYRGLSIHHQWSVPAVRIDAVAGLFEDETLYDWGPQMGPDEHLIGRFSDLILPRLDQDLVGETMRSCGEILHGNTPGLIVLHDGYESINFYSVYRLPTEYELDWGSWAIGIEPWAGKYYIRYLIHYRWEP